jgi:hypothetical protein
LGSLTLFVDVDIGHQEVPILKASFLHHTSPGIDDLGTSERGQIAVRSGDIGADHPNTVVGGQRDVRDSRRRIEFQGSTPFGRPLLVGMKRAVAPSAPCAWPNQDSLSRCG